MSTSRTGNALVMQSGGCTPVLNRSLFGVAGEAFEREAFPQVLGARHGLEGVLSDELADLSRVSRGQWRRIARTPGAALGSTRRKLRPEDVPVVLDVLKRHDIHYWFIIGGNDSAETGHALGKEFDKADWPVSIVNVPKTIDNDLVLTDHCPGFGTAARFVATATMGAGRDAEAMRSASPITILEVMGRDAGWLAASSALARRDEGEAPHLICVPEVPVDEEQFVQRIEDAYCRYGFAVAVIAENTRGPQGVLGGQAEPWFVDDFGHPYYDGPARYLAGLVHQRLRVRARYEKPGTVQRAFAECVSRTDVQEAEMAGRAAVRYALEGHTDRIVTLVRESGRRYACTTGLAPLSEVAGRVRTLPEEYFDAVNGFVTREFIDYCQPLLGSALPRFGRVP